MRLSVEGFFFTLPAQTTAMNPPSSSCFCIESLLWPAIYFGLPINEFASPLYCACYNGLKDVAQFLITQEGYCSALKAAYFPRSIAADDHSLNEGLAYWKRHCPQGHRAVAKFLQERGAVSIDPAGASEI